ncbi:MAG: hypothetical protein HYT87_16350 [Nitrospirae bacterium]|nr:hypothetical protein [Nitrospirota bacterium]
MSKTQRKVLWTLLVLLGGFLPVWWGLVYTGYYDDKMSADKIAYARSFILSDSFLILLTVGLIYGVVKNWVWGYVCGLVVCGTGFYMAIHGVHAMIVGTFPRDPVTVWLYLSNIVGLPILGLILLRSLRRTIGALRDD